MNYMVLIGTFAAWGIVHSLLASLACKDFFRKVLGGQLMRVYRLGYNIFSAISLLPILWLMQILPDSVVYLAPAPWKYFMWAGQGIAALLLLYGFLQTDILSFIGLHQLIESNAEAGTLVTRGLYRFVRHPLYSAGLLFLWLTTSMTINKFIVYISGTIYVFVGAYFEEQKLLREYGAAYAEYRSITPMIIPGLLFKQNKRSP
jgi:protein-S-isoprenylcysteine O-methyltransferase Ste14